MSDSLSICVNANFTAEALEEMAEIKREIVASVDAMDASHHQWSGRLMRWADAEEAAARRIRELVKEIDRLREFEWMYEDLRK